MDNDFRGIEDVIDKITSDLELKGYSKVRHEVNEVGRYTKSDNPTEGSSQIGFVAIQEEEPKEEGFYYIILRFMCSLQASAESVRKIIYFNPMYEFIKGVKVYKRGDTWSTYTTSSIGNMLAYYHIGLDKHRITKEWVGKVIVELIDSTCNYIMDNSKNLTEASSLGKYLSNNSF